MIDTETDTEGQTTNEPISREVYDRTTAVASTGERKVASTGGPGTPLPIDRRSLGALLLCVVAVLGGCATATVDSTVADEETIGEYHLEIEMEPAAFNASREDAIDRGYSPSEPFRDVLETDLDLVRSRVDEIDYEVVAESDGNRTITLTLRGYVPPEDGNVTLTRRGGDGGTLVYEDRLFTNETVTGRTLTGQFQNSTSVEYSLEMPREITNATADSVSGTTATWTDAPAENGTVRVYAESDLPAAPVAAFDHDPADPTVGEAVTFDASASTDDDAVQTYRWDFDGDGSVDETTAAPTVTQTYDEPGQYAVELVAVDADGLASDPATETVSVRATDTPTPTDTGTPSATDTAAAADTPIPTDAEASVDSPNSTDRGESGDSDGLLLRAGLVGFVALLGTTFLFIAYLRFLTRRE